MDKPDQQQTIQVEKQTAPMGKIVGVQGQVILVEFAQNALPQIRDVLVLEEDANVKMEVLKSAAENTFYCIVFSESTAIYRGQHVLNTLNQISVPVGATALARVMNIFGEPLDGGTQIAGTKKTI